VTRLRRSFTLPLPCGEAWELFTATGERRWVSGWEPSFPDGLNDRVAGTVFTTKHGERVTTWVVTVAEPGHRVGYARVTADHTAGIVVVSCRALSSTETEVTVEYELTALSLEAAAELDAFAEGYDHCIDGWRRAILESISG